MRLTPALILLLLAARLAAATEPAAQPTLSDTHEGDHDEFPPSVMTTTIQVERGVWVQWTGYVTLTTNREDWKQVDYVGVLVDTRTANSGGKKLRKLSLVNLGVQSMKSQSISLTIAYGAGFQATDKATPVTDISQPFPVNGTNGNEPDVSYINLREDNRPAILICSRTNPKQSASGQLQATVNHTVSPPPPMPSSPD